MAKSWLFAERQARPIHGEYRLVFTRQEAAEMSNGDAQQLVRAAEREYPTSTWEMIEVGTNSFIVEGTPKTTQIEKPRFVVGAL